MADRRSGAPHGADIDVLVALTYYAPYVSGLTDAARLVNEGLAARGWRIRVLTCRYDGELAPREERSGVDVERCRVVARFGKGVLMPTFPVRISALAKQAPVTHFHLPMGEAVAARLVPRAGLVSTYHCDVSLPTGSVNQFAQRLVDASSRSAIRRSQVTIVTTSDYAAHSRLHDVLARAVPLPPACTERPPGRPTYRDGDGPHVGFLGRIVEEKGLEHLVRAFRALADPGARLLIGGQSDGVAGGSVIERVRAAAHGDDRVRFLGFVPDERLADFYASLDVFTLPSINSFEAFGIVQVEAMMAGIPVVASDLPGVRRPVQLTGFGTLVTPADEQGLAAALAGAVASPPDRAAGRRKACELFSLSATLDAHESIYRAQAAKAGRHVGPR